MALRLAGEFGVIVVGVLVALAADRWMSGRDDRALQETYVLGLVANLEADSATLADLTAQAQERWELAADLLLEAESLADMSPTSLVAAVESLSWSTPPQAFSRETWDDLVSTGRLALIEDPTLRQELSRYYAFLRHYSSLETALAPYFSGFFSEVARAIPPAARLNALDMIPPGRSAVEIESAESLRIRRLAMTDREFSAALANVAIAYRTQVGWRRKLLEEVVAVLSLLRDAL